MYTSFQFFSTMLLCFCWTNWCHSCFLSKKYPFSCGVSIRESTELFPYFRRRKPQASKRRFESPFSQIR
uniref:Secreted protein n=1 Tax=Trichuris muris TaxID=70415 RepID=A0A5S6QVP9_TRIMR